MGRFLPIKELAALGTCPCDPEHLSPGEDVSKDTEYPEPDTANQGMGK
jgi:hypothetical protein